MSDENWGIICEEYLKGLQEKYLTLHLRELPLLKQEEHLKKLKELFDSSLHFSIAVFKGRSLQELIVTESKDDPFEGRIVKIHKLYSSDIKKSFRNIQDFYQHEKRRFLIDIKSSDSSLIHTLEEIDFKNSGSRLVAKVNTSLNLIHKMKLKMPTTYYFRRPLTDELKKIVEIELDVHAHEPTSVLNTAQPDPKEIDHYYGFSATHKVLKQAGKLERKVFEYQYEYRVAL